MFRDMDTIANLILKNNNYKLVTFDKNTNQPKTISQFESDSNKTFSYMAGQSEFCMVSANGTNQSEPKILVDPNDTMTIMGLKCKSLTIDYGISKTVVYFSEEYKVDKEVYKDNSTGFLEYMYRSGALPIKIIMSGNGAVHNMVFTAIEVKKETIEEKEFELPKFKQIMKSPF